MPLHTCTADMEKIYFLFSEKANLVIKSEWLIDFLNNIGVFVLVSPYRYIVVGTKLMKELSNGAPVLDQFSLIFVYYIFAAILSHRVTTV